ncbi:MAG: imidazoleglycerol-phosphate dehydratase HisB [Elusimicrobia bacterium]|nr:imidazoleglycerol-phosphate dehydratase HisB [Elusimicrobiota bacterium]
MRSAEITRNTKETQINIRVNLDGGGSSSVKTPNGFFNHMLELLSKHSGIDIDISAKGDTEVDLHHTVEDIGIVLGEALLKALDDRKGIERYGWVMMPMDEVRCDVALDLGGRSNLVYKVYFDNSADKKESDFEFVLIREFMKALSDHMKATMHFFHHSYEGEVTTNHHIAEAVFKGLARALRQAVRVTGDTIPSTKGVI